MDIEQLRYFLAVCDCKQMTQAADNLYISQSSLSKRISQLEKELGTPLFDRSGRTLHINSAGMDFEAYARKAVAEHEDMVKTIRKRLHKPQATLAIGTIPVLTAYGLHRKSLAFCQENPGIILNFTEGKSDHILQLLEEEQVEMAILRTETLPHDGYKTMELARDNLVLLCSPHHPLAQENTLELANLEEESFFLLDEGQVSRHPVIQACQRASFSPRIKQRFTHIETILGFVAENAGIALLMEKDLTPFDTQKICIKKLTPAISSTVSLLFPHGRQLSPAACLFQDYLTRMKA